MESSVDAGDWLSRIAELIGFSNVPAELSSFGQNDPRISDFFRILWTSLTADKTALNESNQRMDEMRLKALNLEQQLRNIDNQRRLEKEQITDAQSKANHANQRISSLERERDQALADLAMIKGDLERHSNERELSKGRLERLEGEKIELGRIINRKQVEVDELSKQVESLTDRFKELREDSLKNEAALIEANGRISSLNLELTLSQQQADRLRQQTEWTAGELEAALDELANLRRQRQGEITGLQTSLEAKLVECEKLERLVDSLQKSSNIKDERCERLAQELLSAQERLAEETRIFEAEMDAKTRLVELYRAASEEATTRLAMYGSSSQAIIGKAIESPNIEQSNDEKQEHSHSAESLKFRSHAYEQTAELQEELAGLQRENEQLRQCLADICKDLEDRVPQLQQERHQMERLKMDMNVLSDQLLDVGRAREAALVDLEEARRSNEGLVQDNRVLTVQVRDLGRQVQMLLCELEGVAAVPTGEIDTPGVTLESEQIIEGRLVTFRNIRELQVRNQELLRVVRELSAAQEATEVERIKSQDANLREQLTQAQQELTELNESRKRQAAMVEGLVRQRDMLRDLVASLKKEGQDHVQSNESINEANSEGDYDSPKDASPMTEASRKRQRRQTESYLESSLEETRTALGQARSQLAKAQAQVDFGNERYETLQQNYQQQHCELKELKKRHSESVTSIISVQSQLSQLMTDLMSAREREQKANSQLSSLRVELQIAQTSETRLRTEVEQLSLDRDRLGRLMTNLQTMMTENESADAETKQRLTRQIEHLEGELRTARKRLEEELDAHRAVAAGIERDYREMISKYEQLVETTSRSSEELTRARLENSQLFSRIRDLETLLATNEERLQRLLTVSSDASTEPVDMARELGACRMQIANLEDSVKLKEQHVTEYRRIASEAESALQDLTKTYDQYRQSVEEASTKSAYVLEEMRRAKEEVSRERDELVQRLSDLERSFTEARRDWSTQKSTLEQRLGELEGLEEQMKQVSGLKIEDVSRIKEFVDEANQRYQDELIAHGRDLETLQRLRTELGQAKETISTTLSELSTVRTNVSLSESQWQREREALQTRHAELEKSFGELREQNNLLLTQLESLSTPSRIKRDDLGNEETTSGDAAGPSSAELVQVVRFLRRQKDIIQLEHETLLNEHRRTKIQLEQTVKALDEARARLEEERDGSEWRDTMRKEYEALLGKIEQLNLLRESNVTLRHETETLMRKVSGLEERLQESQRRQEPLEREKRELQGQVALLKEQQAELKRDRDEWKRRLDELIEETGQRGGRAAVEAKMEELKGRLAETESTKQALETNLAKLQADLESAQEKIQGADQKEKRILQRANQLRARNEEMAKRIAELESAATSAKEDEGAVAKLHEELGQTRETISTLEQQLGERDLRLTKMTETIQKMGLMSERLAALRTEHAGCAAKLNQAVQTVQQEGTDRLEALRKEYDLRFRALNTRKNLVVAPEPPVSAPVPVQVEVNPVPEPTPIAEPEPVLDSREQSELPLEEYAAEETIQEGQEGEEEQQTTIQHAEQSEPIEATQIEPTEVPKVVNEEEEMDEEYPNDSDTLYEDGHDHEEGIYEEELVTEIHPWSDLDQVDDEEEKGHHEKEPMTSGKSNGNLMEDDEMVVIQQQTESIYDDGNEEDVQFENVTEMVVTELPKPSMTIPRTMQGTVSFTPAPLTQTHLQQQQQQQAAVNNPPRRVVNLPTSSTTTNTGSSGSIASAATTQEKAKKVTGTIDLSQTGKRVLPLDHSPNIGTMSTLTLPSATSAVPRGGRRGGRGAGGLRQRGGRGGRGGGHVPSGESPF